MNILHPWVCVRKANHRQRKPLKFGGAGEVSYNMGPLVVINIGGGGGGGREGFSSKALAMSSTAYANKRSFHTLTQIFTLFEAK